MSVKAMTWAFAQPISGNDKVVLLALADFSDDHGNCWPSIGKIAEKAFVSERTVVRIMATLIEKGYVSSVTRNDQNGRQVANRYALNMCEGEGDNLSEGGDTVVRGEGDTVVTPLKRTTIRNHQRDMSVSDETRPSKPKSSKYGDDYEAFWKSYPSDPGMSKKEGAREWQKLTPTERIAALQAIPAFKIWKAKQGKDYRTLHAVRYLSQRRFEGFAGSEDIWAERLAFARNNHEWGVVWGPLPHQPGCLVPQSLLQPRDGLNWKEWKAA